MSATPVAGLITPLTLLLALWTVVTAAWVTVPFAQGLRGQYFVGLESQVTPAHAPRDPEMSTAWVALRWWFVAPDTFHVRWTGYLVIERAGLYTFQIVSDDGSRLRVGQTLVIEDAGAQRVSAAVGQVRLERGAHRILLESFQRGGPYTFEWAWARDGGPLTPVPAWALSIDRRDPWAVDLMRSLPWLWLAVTAASALALAQLAYRSSVWARLRRAGLIRVAVSAMLLAGLTSFYVIGATEHARRVNTSKARADQSGYLRDAQDVYANWHGQDPPGLIGSRNRMPLYASYLALFWNPRLSNDEFFERAKIWNIRLSLILLVVLGVVFYLHLPPLAATNLLLVVAFGWFIFKAGYTQSELLFYSLFFLTFLACCHLLRTQSNRPSLRLAATTGILAALAHLTKAAALPLVVIFLIVYAGRELVMLTRGPDRTVTPEQGGCAAPAMLRLAVGATMVAAFLAVLSPYISTNKRVFGQYFYNVNTTFYVWYDDWAAASVGTRLHGDDVGWPSLPPSEVPTMARYLSTHTIPGIARRFAAGAGDMLMRSYDTFWYAKYVVLYAAFAGVLVAANPRPTVDLIARRASLFTFLLLYAAIYLAATAFYAPVSGTGTTRFLLSHLMPFLFTCSYFFTRAPFRDSQWSIAGVTVAAAHFHLLILATITLDLLFLIWPRLMSTYGGF